MLTILREKTLLFVVMLVIAGGVIGLMHNRAVEAGRPFMLQDVVRTVLAPGQKFFHSVMAVGGSGLRFLRPVRMVQQENKRLRAEVKKLSMENARLQGADHENARLRAMLGLAKSTNLQLISAEVISRKASGWFSTATINRGRNAGIVEGAAVITERGLVGQVLEANAYTSQIVSINDGESKIAAMIQRTRYAGMLCGQGHEYPVMIYLPKEAAIQPKIDIVVSSGMGGMVPKGIPIGRVERVENASGTTPSAIIRPSVSFDQLEFVYVVKPESAQ